MSRSARWSRCSWLCWLFIGVLSSTSCSRTTSVAPALNNTVQPATVGKIESPSAAVQVQEEAWEAIFLQGTKIGYGKISVEEIRNDSRSSELTVWRCEQHLKMRRFGQLIEQTISYETSHNKQGELLSLRSNVSGGNMNHSATGEVKDGLLELKVTTGGKESRESIPWDAQLRGFFGVEQSLRHQPLQPGELRKLSYFQPIANTIGTVTLQAQEWEQSPLLEGSKKLLKVHMETRVQRQLTHSYFWMNERGDILRSTLPSLMQESFRTSREVAEQPSSQIYDLGRASVVKVNRPLDRHVELKRVVYQATLKAANPEDQFPQCLSQRVTKVNDHTAKIEVLRITPEQPATLEQSISPPEAGDTTPNALIQSDDSLIRQYAAEINGDDAWKLATEIESFVNRKLTKKNFSQAFASAAEVAKTLEGDCTEHAVLLAAICRAKKLPARVAAGLVYYGVEQGFAYHMWNEVWIHDRWVPLDATLARGGIGGGHIKLFDSNLEGASAFSAFLPVVNVLGQLELEILEVE